MAAKINRAYQFEGYIAEQDDETTIELVREEIDLVLENHDRSEIEKETPTSLLNKVIDGLTQGLKPSLISTALHTIGSNPDTYLDMCLDVLNSKAVSENQYDLIAAHKVSIDISLADDVIEENLINGLLEGETDLDRYISDPACALIQVLDFIESTMHDGTVELNEKSNVVLHTVGCNPVLYTEKAHKWIKSFKEEIENKDKQPTLTVVE